MINLTDIVFKVICGDSSGTAFLISEHQALTAFHVVAEHAQSDIVISDGRNKICKAKLSTKIDTKYEALDVALLELSSPINHQSEIIFSRFDSIPNGTKWSTRGFPGAKIDDGDNILEKETNVVNQHFLSLGDRKVDIELEHDQKLTSYEGYSGAPLIINGVIAGIIKSEMAEQGASKELCALSLKYFEPLLAVHRIVRAEHVWIEIHRRWMVDGLSDKATSTARFGQNISVISDESHYIQRKATNIAIDKWWANRHSGGNPFVLLGDEGDGKSWALTAWVAAKLEDTDFSIPIIFLPANRVENSKNVVKEMAKCLNQSATNITVDEWEKRLDPSKFNSPDGPINSPSVLLVVDGLNERRDQNWQVWFDQCVAPPLKGYVALMVSCRKDYWDSYLDNLYRNKTFIYEQQPFDNNELSQALALQPQRLTLAGFSKKLRKLMAKPRYFDMAIRLKRELEVAGDDITIDRLIYEDWRDMTRRKRGASQPLTHDEFQELITGLADKYKDSFDRKSLKSELAGFSDEKHLYEELQSSGIIRPTGKRGQFKVAERPMFLGLGLLLADEVQASEELNYQGIMELIAIRLVDHSIDLVAQICAMALFQSLSSEDYPDMGRIALFMSWIKGRNFDQADVERIRAYFPLRPHIFFQVAEFLWSGRHDNREVQDNLMRAFVQERHFHRVEKAMVEAFERWLGCVQPLGVWGAFEKNEEKLNNLRLQFKERWEKAAESGELTILGYQLEIIEDMNLLRLAQTAIAVISHFDRQPFINAILTGIVAKVMMNGSHSDFSWLLRTASPQVQQLLIDKAKQLIDCNEPVAFKVAYRLLSDICSEQALKLRQTLPAEYSPIPFEDDVDALSTIWDKNNYQEYVLHKKWHPLFKAKKLQAVAVDPLNTLDQLSADQLKGGLDVINVAEINSHPGVTPEDMRIAEIEAAFCAYQPAEYQLLAQEIQTVLTARTGHNRYLAARQIFEYLPVLKLPASNILLDVWRQCLSGSNNDDQSSEAILFTMVIFSLTALEQLALVLERGDCTNHMPGYEPQFTRITTAELTLVENKIKDAGKGEKPNKCLLWYLSLTLPELNEPLRVLVLNWFNTGDSIVRGNCLRIFSKTKDSMAAKTVINGGWAATLTKETNFEDEWGSTLLCEQGNLIPFSSLAARVMVKDLGFAWQKRGRQDKELRDYVMLIHVFWLKISPHNSDYDALRYAKIIVDNSTEINHIRYNIAGDDQANKLSNDAWGGQAGKSHDNRKITTTEQMNVIQTAINTFYEKQTLAGNYWSEVSFKDRNLKDVVNHSDEYWQQWIAPILDGSNQGRELIYTAQGFYEQLCEVLIDHNPEVGERLYCHIIETEGSQIIDKLTGIRRLFFAPFKAKESAPVLALRKRFFEQSESDSDLLELVLLSQLSGQQDWLKQLISSLLKSTKDFDNARGLQLLGLAEDGKAECQLKQWIDVHGCSWVRDVAYKALNQQERNQWAKHWLTKFATENDTIQAWAAFRLFLKCLDRRYWIWSGHFLQQHPLSEWKKMALKANQGIIGKAIKENEKTAKLKSEFVGHNLKHRQLWPWMKEYQK